MTTDPSKGLPCPVCKVDLLMSDRQGIEIDYCPKCRGVWLDRGELDKIIERNVTESAPAPPVASAPSIAPYRAQPWGYGEPGHHGERHGGHYGDDHHRRRGFLGHLFD